MNDGRNKNKKHSQVPSMKTFTRSAFHLPPSLRLSAILPLFESLCIQRKGAVVCCMPGAPIVRLPRS
jgi:hypothetical protein